MACFHHAQHGFVGVQGFGGAAMPFREPGVTCTYGPSWTFRVKRLRARLRIDVEARCATGQSVFEIEGYPGFDGVVRLSLDGPEVHEVTVDGSPAAFRLGDGELVVRDVPETAEVCVRYTSASPAADA